MFVRKLDIEYQLLINDEDEYLFHKIMSKFHENRETRRLNNRCWDKPPDNPEDAKYYRYHALIQIQKAEIPIYDCLINIVISYLSNNR